jgi:deoxyribose-phosphate aldolase
MTINSILQNYSLNVDEAGARERAAMLASRSVKSESKLAAIRMAISMIDLTTLEGKDTEGKIVSLCRKAITPMKNYSEIPSVAAICVYPHQIVNVRKYLNGSNVKIASVATSFPSGQSMTEIKQAEVKKVIQAGADEVDMVISRGEFLSGNLELVSNEISEIKKICGDVHLKVILETGELETLDNVRKASILAMHSGADFIKTSTGKINPAATLPVTLVMLEAIRDYFDETGRKVGMKPAGGIKTTKDAISYLCLVRETLGNDWLTPDLFRIGASSVLNDLLMQYTKQKVGNYQSIIYYSND